MLLFFPLLLAGLSGCNFQDPVEEAPDISQNGPQLAPNAGGAAHCVECAGGCILGFDFTTTDYDGNHPQGGYRIMLVTGDCECELYDGSWSAVTTGPSTVEIGQVGGPGSGSIGSLTGHAWDIWRFNCVGGGGWGGIPMNNWGDWVSDVTGILQTPNPPNPIGVVSWPGDWNVTFQPAGNDGKVRVDLPFPIQATALDEIRIIDTPSGEPVAVLPGDGSASYLLDLSALPNGGYTFELEFDPGFVLYEPMQKVPVHP